MRGVHDGGVDHHVVVEEVGRSGGVGADAADGPRHQEHVLGPVGPEPVVHGRLVAQVELVPGGHQQVSVAEGSELAQQRAADEPAVAGHEDAGVGRMARGPAPRRSSRLPGRRRGRHAAAV